MNSNNVINSSTNSNGWTSFTTSITATSVNPTKGTVVTDVSYFFPVGKILYVHYSYKQSSAGSAGSGNYLFSIPSEFTINTNITGTFASNLRPAIGSFSSSIGSPVNRNGVGSAFVYDATHYGILINAGDADPQSNSNVSSGYFYLGLSTLSYSGILVIPIN